MAGVSDTITREYFELHEFLVRQPRKHISQTRHDEDDDIDFFVLNPQPKAREGALPFVLSSAELPFLERAVVVVKAWHTDTFSSARLMASPEILRFVESRVFQEAARAFSKDDMPLKILVVPSLPQDAQGRERSINLLKSKGIDAVLPFRTMLNDLVAHTEVNRNYQKSDLLQTIRILKNYDFLREPQMELFKTRKRKGQPGAGTQG
jgi:hypothetical protein